MLAFFEKLFDKLSEHKREMERQKALRKKELAIVFGNLEQQFSQACKYLRDDPTYVAEESTHMLEFYVGRLPELLQGILEDEDINALQEFINEARIASYGLDESQLSREKLIESFRKLSFRCKALKSMLPEPKDN